MTPRAIRASQTARPWISASAVLSLRRGQNSRGRKLTMVSIMSIGAGSVGVSARPALPTTMSTSGNRQRTMSRAFRSSTDSVTDARGTVIGMSMTIPSSSGVMNSRASGCIVWSATRATISRLAGASTAVSRRSREQGRRHHRQEQGRQEDGPAAQRGETQEERHAQHPGQGRRPVHQVRQDRPIDLDHAPDQRVLHLGPQPAPNEDRAERRHQRDRQHRRRPPGRTSWCRPAGGTSSPRSRPARRRAGTTAP